MTKRKKYCMCEYNDYKGKCKNRAVWNVSLISDSLFFYNTNFLCCEKHLMSYLRQDKSNYVSWITDNE